MKEKQTIFVSEDLTDEELTGILSKAFSNLKGYKLDSIKLENGEINVQLRDTTPPKFIKLKGPRVPLWYILKHLINKLNPIHH